MSTSRALMTSWHILVQNGFRDKSQPSEVMYKSFDYRETLSTQGDIHDGTCMNVIEYDLLKLSRENINSNPNTCVYDFLNNNIKIGNQRGQKFEKDS